MASNLKLVDEEDRVLARFENASWSRKEQDSLMIYGGRRGFGEGEVE